MSAPTGVAPLAGIDVIVGDLARRGRGTVARSAYEVDYPEQFLTGFVTASAA